MPPPALRATFDQVKIIVSRKGALIAEVLPDKERLIAGRLTGHDIVLSHATISKRQFQPDFTERGVVLSTPAARAALVNGISANRPTVVPHAALARPLGYRHARPAGRR